MINVLVVGGGAREHAICSAVKQSKNTRLYTVMSNSNPGISRLASDYMIGRETDVELVVEYAKSKGIDLALIGPEAPLEKGLTDALLEADIKVCAPIRSAARIETDKRWMRNLLEKYRIPGQVKFKVFDNPDDAALFIKDLGLSVAIKPIGLTGGKGVKVYGDHFNTLDEAMGYVRSVISERIGGSPMVQVEEKMIGEEFTLQAFTDGSYLHPLPLVQDHKRLLPGDQGVNTGGMGSYSCPDGLLPFLSQSDYDEGVMILRRIVDALRSEGCAYTGPIYGQFILTADGVRVIEVNARFGDPEAMNILPLLKSDYVDLCYAMIEGNLSRKKIRIDEKATVCKYVVPEGYGTRSIVDARIDVDEAGIKKTGARLFYASVNMKDDGIYTTSSRSLAVLGVADTLTEAESICEKGLSFIHGDHIFIRHDIGTKELIERRINHMRMLRGGAV
jgi:phosphoribosylamine--glycine ligase